MVSVFRSQEMTLCQLFIHTDSAYMCVSELGELGLVQFRDTVPETSAFQRKFVNEVRRCDEMERKLRFLETEIKKDEIQMLEAGGDNVEAPAPKDIIELESDFEKLEVELLEVNTNSEQLKKNFLELCELKQILRKTQNFFDEAMNDPAMTDEAIGLLSEDGLRAGGAAGQGLRLGFVAGVILRERLQAFELLLWRACHGNVFLKQAEIENDLEDPITSDKVKKSVFIIFFQGDQLKSRVIKICEGFHASLYPCPDSQAERREMAIGVMSRIDDLRTVLNQTQEHRHRLLTAAARHMRAWLTKVHKIKAIYHALNQFNLDVTAKCMIGECWCAVMDLDRIQLALRRGMERSGGAVQPILNRIQHRSSETPPTYHVTNKFTRSFQELVDAYGVANYQEINPGPFLTVTFPFLFAVMFGDAGHGLIMLLFALWMVLRERHLERQKLDNEIWNMMFGGRYIILLMAAFSIYTGLLYNDVYSLSLNVFGSSWYPGEYTTAAKHGGSQLDTALLQKFPQLQMNPENRSVYSGSPYPFGLDPVWQTAKNKITFINSIKMKMSVILGVFQMVFGIFLSLFNHHFFKNKLNVFCQFLPELIFMLSIFGYLNVVIFAKWISFDASQSACAPSLLIGFINMFMFRYDAKLAPGQTCSPLLPWFRGQQQLQTFLVLLAFACVPWMLLVKPYLLRKQHLERLRRPHKSARGFENGRNNTAGDGAAAVKVQHNANADGGGAAGDGDAIIQMEREDPLQPHEGAPGEEEDKFDLAEVCVHQAIHTIEFCLGCISSTASYLRLWALSLAHAQLSEVLWSMVMAVGLSMDNYGGAVAIFFCFGFWAMATLGILLIMEGLSAFLHALRLHWVEFQYKFYGASGHKFVPFSFALLSSGD